MIEKEPLTFQQYKQKYFVKPSYIDPMFTREQFEQMLLESLEYDYQDYIAQFENK